MKRILSGSLIFLLVFTMLPGLLDQDTNTAYAEPKVRKILFSAYFDFWQDPSTGKWLYDDGGARREFSGFNAYFEDYSFPLEVFLNHKIKDIEIYDPNKDYGSDLEILTTADLDKLRNYKAPHISLTNKSELIGKQGTVIMKANVRLGDKNNTEHKPGPSGITVFRNYVPRVVYLESTEQTAPPTKPNEPALVVSGEASPNPAKLSGGKADVKVTVNSQVNNLKEDIKSWELSYQKPDGTFDKKLFENYRSHDVSFTFGEVAITGNHVFPIKAVLKTISGKTLEADGKVSVVVEGDSGGDYTINPEIYLYARPDVVDISRYDWKNNNGVNVQLEMDASNSTASLGIDKYLYVYRKEASKSKWQESGFTNDSTYFADLTIYPNEANSDKVVEARGHVGVMDKAGHIKYSGNKTEKYRFNIVPTPPETQIEKPQFLYPIEITRMGTLVNRLSWDYKSPDQADYKHSIVSLYKLVNDDYVPVFENQIQTKRELFLEGEKDEEFKLKVIVVDEDDIESEPAEEYLQIENADPVIDVKIKGDKIDENKLLIDVENKTPLVIETVFPTEYKNWRIINTNGIVLEQGSGKLPEEIEIDERYDGQIITAIQYAENILKNKAKGKDSYILDTFLDFEIDPNRLFEFEMATIKDLSRGITNKEWQIQRMGNDQFYELALNEDMEFTKDAGNYFVKLLGDGKYGHKETAYQYSNNRQDLKLAKEPTTQPTAEELKSALGENVAYGQDSGKWISRDVEKGTFKYNGTSYSYRRAYSYHAITTEKAHNLKPVEFISAKPQARFTASKDYEGNFKVNKKITLDGSPSIAATNKELQEKYPILFDNEKSLFVIEPLTKANGTPDYTKNEFIKGEGKKTIDGKVTFPGDIATDDPKIREIRIDKAGIYKISYKVCNALKESDWVSQEINVYPKEEPKIDINVDEPITYRMSSNELKSTIGSKITYTFQEGTLDPEHAKIYISYDFDGDGNFTNDGIHSNQWVTMNDENLLDYLEVVEKNFGDNETTISLYVSNEERNLLGKFKFEFEGAEKPTVPDFDLPGDTIPKTIIDTFKIDSSKKEVLIDNAKPIIELDMYRGNVIDLDLIDVATDPKNQFTEADIETILKQLDMRGIKIRLKHIKADGSSKVYEN